MAKSLHYIKLSVFSRAPASFRLLRELLALQTDLVRKFGVQRDLLPQRDSPRLRVSLRVVHRHPDFEVPVVGPADSLGGCFGDHATVLVDPEIVAEALRGDDEGVALPCGRRVSLQDQRENRNSHERGKGSDEDA